MFELRSENLTGLGGPMGTERTWTNWRKFYTSVELAKEAAQADFKRHEIKWIKERYGWRSPDLLYVMYHINPVKVEK